MFRIILVAAALLALSACTSQGRIDYSAPGQKDRQNSAIARWNRCLDTHLKEQAGMKTSAYAAVQNSLKLCHGHSQDVLATYPRRLEKPLSEKLEAMAISEGLKKMAIHKSEMIVLQKALPELELSEN